MFHFHTDPSFLPGGLQQLLQSHKNRKVLVASDLRPISVTSVMVTLVERMVVKDLIMPHIALTQLYNQFCYRPSGCTEGALVDLTHTISNLLENNKYVRCLLIDFSKAFVSVDHAILITKLAQYGLWLG